MKKLNDKNSKLKSGVLDEAIYLLRSPENAARLRESIKQVEEGNVVFHDLIKLKKNKSSLD